MVSSKLSMIIALMLLLQCHWIQCQCCNGYGGYGYPPITVCCDNNKDLDILLPLLIIALSNNCGNNSPPPYPYTAGPGSCGCGNNCGCGSGCSCGCNCGCKCCCSCGY